MPLTIFKRGEVYHYRGTVAGRRLRGSTGTADKKTAQRIASDREAREWRRNLDGPDAVLRFSDASILYRQSGRSNRFLDAVEDYWKDTLVKDITAGSIRQAAIVLYPTQSNATRNRHVIVPTQAIINYAAEMELCSPVKVKRFPEDTKLKKPVSWEWVSAFMANANPHLGALACFMFMTAARISEALDVRWKDVDLSARRAVIRETKTSRENKAVRVGKERSAHLPPELVAAIANIEGERKPEEKVFKYSSRHTADPQWEAVIVRAKIERLTFHSCRHGFATTLLHKGVDPVTVAKLGGWSSAQHVFETYGHAMEDDTLADLMSGTPLTRDTVIKGNFKARTTR